MQKKHLKSRGRNVARRHAGVDARAVGSFRNILPFAVDTRSLLFLFKSNKIKRGKSTLVLVVVVVFIKSLIVLTI
jgi:hypothetical protein